jgi:two-component system chemotaxis response regulator CheB
MANRDVIVVGASAGGVEALRAFVAGLPVDLPACVFVVLHMSAASPGVLPAILSRAGRLPAAHPADGDKPVQGRIYVAPPDHHLLLRAGGIAVSRGPRENGHRPAVDPLFRSAAEVYGNRVLAVVMSGSLDDGAAGAGAVVARGGLLAVQDPGDALYPSMPRHAAAAATPDLVAPARRLGALVAARTREAAGSPRTLGAHGPVPAGGGTKGELPAENAVAGFDVATLDGEWHPPRPSGFSCPDCQGTLFEYDDQGMLRFRCRVGHAWSAVSLLARQDSSLEHALWMALRNLEEKAALSDRMAELARARGNLHTGARYDEASGQARRAAATMRLFLIDAPASARVDESEPTS